MTLYETAPPPPANLQTSRQTEPHRLAEFGVAGAPGEDDVGMLGVPGALEGLEVAGVAAAGGVEPHLAEHPPHPAAAHARIKPSRVRQAERRRQPGGERGPARPDAVVPGGGPWDAAGLGILMRLARSVRPSVSSGSVMDTTRLKAARSGAVAPVQIPRQSRRAPLTTEAAAIWIWSFRDRIVASP